MFRFSRSFAALLIAAAPLNARAARVVRPSVPLAAVAPTAAALPSESPAFSDPSSFSLPSEAPALSAPAVLPIAAAVAPNAPPAGTEVSAAPNAGRGSAPAQIQALAAAAADPTADSRSPLFDGQDGYATRSGAYFVPSATPHPAVEGAPLIRIKQSPLARVRPVPGAQRFGGARLLNFLTSLTSSRHQPRSKKSTWKELFSRTDNHTLNGVPGVADAYSGIFIPGTSTSGRDYTMAGDHIQDGYLHFQTMNVEHVFPQLFFRHRQPMLSDLHILMATFEHPNGIRRHLPLGIASQPFDYENDAGARRGGGVFEPPNFTKGRAARAMLYAYIRYRKEPFFTGKVAQFWNSQIETLLNWNRHYPTTVEEMARNDYAERHQRNRNPFIDDWRLADLIGHEALLAPIAPPAQVRGKSKKIKKKKMKVVSKKTPWRGQKTIKRRQGKRFGR